MASRPDLDAEQAQLDGEDAVARLAALSRAITRLTEAESLVTSLTAQLRQAKRRMKDRKWDVQGLILAERRKAGAGPPPSPARANGKRS